MPPIGRLAGATLWILVGGALAGGVYWAFLNTPESSAGSLLLSALLAVVALALAGFTLNGAIATWDRGPRPAAAYAATTNAVGIFPGLAIILAIWWIAGRATGWVSAHSGEINAWFISQFGLADVSALFAAVNWISRWLRWVLAPLLALALLASIGASGWVAAFRTGWLRKALSPARLILATLWFGVLVAAPWIYLAPWRPRGLPATSAELVFISAKLLLTVVLMATGIALMIREATRPTAPTVPRL